MSEAQPVLETEDGADWLPIASAPGGPGPGGPGPGGDDALYLELDG